MQLRANAQFSVVLLHKYQRQRAEDALANTVSGGDIRGAKSDDATRGRIAYDMMYGIAASVQERLKSLLLEVELSRQAS